MVLDAQERDTRTTFRYGARQFVGTEQQGFKIARVPNIDFTGDPTVLGNQVCELWGLVKQGQIDVCGHQPLS